MTGSNCTRPVAKYDWLLTRSHAMVISSLSEGGANVISEWRVGSPIVWRGEWDGKNYEDKGEILEMTPGRRLVHTHFSPLGGREDVAANYHTVTWTLEDLGGTTRLTLSQGNNASAVAAQHSQGMWDRLVVDIKQIVERA